MVSPALQAGGQENNKFEHNQLGNPSAPHAAHRFTDLIGDIVADGLNDVWWYSSRTGTEPWVIEDQLALAVRKMQLANGDF